MTGFSYIDSSIVNGNRIKSSFGRALQHRGDLPVKLSGPCCFKILSKSESEPLPEIGRISASGTTSCGRLSVRHSGSITFVSSSNAPEARNMAIAVISAISAGSTLIATVMPSFAPLIKRSKTFSRRISPAIMIITITSGIT